MTARTVTIAAVSAGCIAAAGIGGFLAQRMNSTTVPTVEAVEAQPVAPASAPEHVAPPAATQAEATPAARPPAAAPTRPAPVRAAATAKPAAAAPTQTVVEPPPPVTAVPPPVAEMPPPPIAEPIPLPPPAPVREYIELTIKEDSVIGIRLESGLTSETAKVEDRVTAVVTRDVMADGRTAIPAGARLEGHVALVEQGGKFKERARLGVRFTHLLLSDDTRVRIQTETVYREGEGPGGEATSKIGASAVVGAILGAMVGGGKGAAIGGAAGAAGGTAVVAAGDRNHAVLAGGTPLTVRLTQPVTLIIER